jgi:hypothetical protein
VGTGVGVGVAVAVAVADAVDGRGFDAMRGEPKMKRIIRIEWGRVAAVGLQEAGTRSQEPAAKQEEKNLQLVSELRYGIRRGRRREGKDEKMPVSGNEI